MCAYRKQYVIPTRYTTGIFVDIEFYIEKSLFDNVTYSLQLPTHRN
jgi:hypothetical protein